MTAPVKKPYNSALRTAQARATRRAIVDAAAGLFIERGYGATTVNAIAAAAGDRAGRPCSPQSAARQRRSGSHSTGRSPATTSRCPCRTGRTSRPCAGTGRPADPRRLRPQRPRGLRADRPAQRRAAGRRRTRRRDPRARRGERGAAAAWHADPGRGADQCDALKPGLTAAEAADILWLLNDPAVYHRLVIEQGWTPDRYQDWLAETFISLLLPAGYQPRPASPSRHRSPRCHLSPRRRPLPRRLPRPQSRPRPRRGARPAITRAPSAPSGNTRPARAGASDQLRATQRHGWASHAATAAWRPTW